MERKQRNTVAIAVVGGVLVMLILVLGSIWMGQSAKKDTEAAVRTVSLLYLDELAGRREQVVAENLKDRIEDMETALDLMTEEDLRDDAHRQAYQTKMKALFNIEKFAFADTEGRIYTSVGVQDDIDEYSFDHRSITGAEISLKNLDTEDKKVIIALPVDLTSQGRHFSVCFMEIDMEEMLSGVSMKSQESGATFCNIYTATGVALSNTVLGGLAQEDNLLDAMQSAEYEEGYSYDTFLTDFQSGTRGEVSFTYNGIKEMLAYVPVEGTDWLLTYLIRESVISDEISTISGGVITRSVIQSALTVVILLIVFAYVVLQTRRNAQLTLERETADAENRVKQQALEQRLSLQEKLLEEEKQRTQQDQMITALASDYRIVYYVDLNKNEGICYRADPEDSEQTQEGVPFPYHERFQWYAENVVAESYREGFLRFIDPENIRVGLEREPILAYRYLARREGKEYYEMIRVAGVRHKEERTDHRVHAIGLGLTVIDVEMREALAKNQTLAEALTAAEDANKAKTAFLSNMSHEIRTPMNAIIGLDSIALNDPSISDTTRDYLEKIGASARHLLGIINDILDMSRIESGRMVIKSEEFSFAKTLAQVNTIINGQCRDKGLQYDCHVIGNLDDSYIGDDMKLRQVMINILGNAVKFTPEGGKVVFTVEEVARFSGKSTLRFVFRDTGIGMSKEYLPKIFDAFSQEDSSATNRYGSTGLGMPITKSIVELMNGHIEVDSEKGKGTTFTVTITLLRADRRDEGEKIAVDPQEMCVLVIDDDPIACEHAQVILGQVGINCETALSGTDGVEMVRLRHARREPYNLILVDWKMPDLDGVETARQIRETIGDETPVIILTSYSWDDIEEEARQAGVDAFLAKPLFAGTVLDEFREA
ncbi:MAG: response regulator, partial [Oscillospiraceae bacterium]|nr:response regulator [Oscillospiraceae bacterium]